MRRYPFPFLLGLVAAAAVALRVALLVWWAEPLPDVGDAMAYHQLGAQLARGEGYERPFGTEGVPTAEYPPLFPAAVAAMDAAGIDGAMGQRYAGAVLGALGVVLTALAGRAAAGPGRGLAAAAVVAVHPLAMGHDTTLLSEGLAVATGATVVLVALRLRERGAGGVAGALTLGAVIGVASMVRAEALLLVPLLGFAWRPRRLALGIVAGCALVAAPWVARNAVALDSFVPVSTNAATALDGANCDATYRGPLVGYWVFAPGCFEGYREDLLRVDGEAAVAARHRAQGLAYARSHASEWPGVVAARVARVWGAWSLDQQVFLGATEGKSPRAERAGTVFGWVLVPAALVGLVLLVLRGDRLVAWILAAPLVAVTVTAAVTYGNPRFRAGAEPAIAILATMALRRRG